MNEPEAFVAIRGGTIFHALVNIVLLGAIVMLLIRVTKKLVSKK